MQHESRALELVRRQEVLAAERGVWESHWQEIAELLTPFRADFLGSRTPGEKRTSKVFDGTAGMAAENLAAGLWGLLTNSANTWFQLRHEEEALNEDQAVKVWLDEAGKRLLGAFASGGQRFYARVVDLFSDLVHFGTAVFYADEVPGQRGLYFSCRHLAECYIAENEQEQVDTLFRRFAMTARQVAMRFPESLSAKLKERAEKRPDERVELLHAVLPAREYAGGESEAARRRQGWASVYVALEEGRVLSEGGYWDFPYQVPRWSQRSRAVYGDSPAMLALSDAKMLNQMSRTLIVGAQKQVDPPLLAADEAAVRALRAVPGGVIYGGLDPQGRRLYEPLVSGGNTGLGLQLEEQRRGAVKEAFYASLLMLVNQPGRTATEVLALQEEKLRLMGPHLGRVQAEFLDPLIHRVFGILMRRGELPPWPPAMGGGAVKIEYVSPMARAQRASEAQAVMRTFEATMPLAQVDPSVRDLFDAEQAARVVAGAFGMPAKVLRGAEELAERRAASAEQGQLAGLLGAAGPVAGAVKDVAGAAKAAPDMMANLAQMVGQAAGGGGAPQAGGPAPGPGAAAAPGGLLPTGTLPPGTLPPGNPGAGGAR